MQLDSLKDVLGHDGPFITIDAEVGRTGEDATQQLEARWTTLRHRLEDAEVQGALVEQLGDRLHANSHLPGEQRRTLVAADEQVVLDDVHALHAWWPETFDVGALPDLAGWVRAEESGVPFLLVRIDRVGAELEAYRAQSRPPAESETVRGTSYYITKVPEGDWAQKQFQQTAENRWRQNAEEVAEAIRSLARRHRPRLVLVAGDVRARAELGEVLADVHELGADLVQLESGGRAAGVSEDAMWQEVEVALAADEAHRERDLADRMAEGASNGIAVAGLGPVLDALVDQRVDTLLLDLDTVGEMTMRPADHPGLALPGAAAASEELPADRALVAAGALSGAGLALMPTPLMQASGVAALLRWSQ